MEDVQKYIEFGLVVVGAASTVAAAVSTAFNTDKGTKVSKVLAKLLSVAQLVGLHKPSVKAASKSVDHRG